MRNWFWILMLSDGKLRWPRWFVRILALFFIAVLCAGFIYAYVVFHAVSERSEQHHVHAHSTH